MTLRTTILAVAAMFLYTGCGNDSSNNSTEFSDEISSGADFPSSSESNSSIAVSSSSTPSSSSKMSKTDFLNPNISYSEITDARDGQTYKTVLIGTRYWMAENLNYKTANSFCYDDLEENCELYGRLYTWSAAMDSAGVISKGGENCGYGQKCTPDSIVQGVCPQGWHLPSSIDLSILFGEVGGIDVATLALKTPTAWRGVGRNEYGFSATAAGLRDADGVYSNKGKGAYLWSTGEANDREALRVNLFNDGHIAPNTISNGDIQTNQSNARFISVDKKNANSIRCVRDSVPGDTTIKPERWKRLNPEIAYGELTDERDGKVYKTVVIGAQTWMAENLNYAADGRHCYNNVSQNCEKYGGYYKWPVAIDSAGEFSDGALGCGRRQCEQTLPVRGICPEGWHIPSCDEVKTLFSYTGADENADVLITKDGWKDRQGTDLFGFSAFPTGFMYQDFKNSYNMKEDFIMITSSKNRVDGDNACGGHISYNTEGAYTANPGIFNAYTVRCLKD